MTGLLRRVQMRLVAGVMLDSGEAVRAVGGEFRVGTLVRAVEAGKQLHALELQVGLRVPTVEVVEAGHALERVGHSTVHEQPTRFDVSTLPMACSTFAGRLE